MKQPKYDSAFKRSVVEAMRANHWSYGETARRFGITGHSRVQAWEKRYLAEGPEGLCEQRRGRKPDSEEVRASKRAQKKREQELLREVRLLRAENALLKTRRALADGRQSAPWREPSKS